MFVRTITVIFALVAPVFSAPVSAFDNAADSVKRNDFDFGTHYSPPPCRDGDCPDRAVGAWGYWDKVHSKRGTDERRPGHSGWQWDYAWSNKRG